MLLGFLVLSVCGCQGARRASPASVSLRTLKTIQIREALFPAVSSFADRLKGFPSRRFGLSSIRCSRSLLTASGSRLPRIDLVSACHPWHALLPRKEVIQPHLPIRLPCYDFTPVIDLTFVRWLLAVTSLPSGAPNSHGVTGGVYKARERIHRGMLIRDY